MHLQLAQIKKIAIKQGLESVKLTIIDSGSVVIGFRFKAEFGSNDIDHALLVTQKNEPRCFKTLDSAYKLVSSLLCPEKDLFVDVIVRSSPC